MEFRKDNMSEYCKNCYELQEQLNQLKAEKEKIKKYLGISSKTIMERLKELQDFRDNDNDKLYQAEQKIEKIKDIIIQCTKNTKCSYCKYDDECGGYSSLSEMMLQIIEG